MTRWSIILSVVLVLAVAVVVQACPMCKDAIPNNDAQSAATVPGGFNLSIYYMLGSLFCVVAGFGLFIVRTIRATDRANHRPPPSSRQ